MIDRLALSPQQLRKLALLPQQLYHSSGTAETGCLNAIKQLGYVQIDSISVAQRAHHHTLWNRVGQYREAHLTTLLKRGDIFEYWAHAAAYLPIDDYRFSLVRKQKISQGEEHWFKCDHKMMSYVLDCIAERGPMMAKAFTTPSGSNKGWWDWKPAKQALEQLYMQGELMVVERRGFQKVYDLTQNVLPAEVDCRLPSEREYCEFLITSYLRAHNIASLENFTYLLKGGKQPVQRQLSEMLAQGLIIELSVAGNVYYAAPNVEQQLQKKIAQKRLKILSPFDNVVIQRKRLREVFQYNYQIECYVPAAKRQYGYFSMPLLLGSIFVGRIDIKIERIHARMIIRHLSVEHADLMFICQALAEALPAFMSFQGAVNLTLERVSHQEKTLKTPRRETIKLLLEAALVAV